jgi:hypothetical protein
MFDYEYLKEEGVLFLFVLSISFGRPLAERAPLLNVPDFFRLVPRSTHPDLEELWYNDIRLHPKTTAGGSLTVFA